MWITPKMYDTTKLTVELREIIEAGVDIWNFEYPCFFEGEAKKDFEKKITDHFYFRQIGQETVGRWLHMFRSRMREIMPYYNQLYESEKYMQNIEDPFATVDYTETFEEESSGQSNTSANGKTNGFVDGFTEHRYSNTPQGTINNIDDYLTEASKDTVLNEEETTSESSSTGATSGTVKHTLTKKGAMGVTTFGHDMMEYRQSFLNIDLMVIKELNDLFLGIY